MRLIAALLVLVASLGAASPSHAKLTRRGGEIAVRTAKGIQYPSLAALPGGGFVVVWSEPTANVESTATVGALLRTAAPPPHAAFVLRSHKDVFAAWFDADGQLVRGPMVVNQAPTGETTTSWYAEVAADPAGTVLIVWRNWKTRQILARFFDAEGNATSSEVQITPDLSGVNGEVAVAATAPGEFVVIWNDLNDVLPYDRHLLLGRPVAVDGTIGDIFTVSRIEAPANQLYPSVVSIDTQRLLVTWFNAVGEQSIQARFLGDVPLRPTFDVAGGQDERRPRVCVSRAGDFLFAWEGYQSAFEPPRFSDRGAWFRRYTAMREPLDDPLPVLFADYSVKRVSGVVCLPDEAPMVVVAYNGALVGRSIDGAAITTDFEIVAPYVSHTNVTSLSTPGFVVTWGDCVDPGPDQEPDCVLRAQMFSQDGPSPCPGDCSLNDEVTIDELILATRIALGSDSTEMRVCLPADRNLNYRVDISELIAAVATSLGGCE